MEEGETLGPVYAPYYSKARRHVCFGAVALDSRSAGTTRQWASTRHGDIDSRDAED